MPASWGLNSPACSAHFAPSSISKNYIWIRTTPNPIIKNQRKTGKYLCTSCCRISAQNSKGPEFSRGFSTWPAFHLPLIKVPHLLNPPGQGRNVEGLGRLSRANVSDRPCWCNWADDLCCRNSRASLSVLWRRMAAWMRETLKITEVKACKGLRFHNSTWYSRAALWHGLSWFKTKVSWGKFGQSCEQTSTRPGTPTIWCCPRNWSKHRAISYQSLLQSLARFWSLFLCGDSNII